MFCCFFWDCFCFFLWTTIYSMIFSTSEAYTLHKVQQWFQCICNTSDSIWGCLSQECSNKKNIICPMSFFWFFILLGLWVSLHTIYNQTFYLDEDISRIWMHQGKLQRAYLSLGIFSYDQNCNAFSWFCRAFDRLARAPLSPSINL